VMRFHVRALTAIAGAAALSALGFGQSALAGPSLTTTTSTDLASLVNTLTWTSGGGNTFPGADVPFGMVQWSPDVPGGGAGGGYDIGATSLMGFGLTHISGPGCGAAGDVPILPMTGSLPSNPNSYNTSLSHNGEVAQAGYYSVQSNAPNTITSEFTATPHSAMGRFTFPSTTQADFLIKLMDSQNGDYATGASVIGNDEVMGYDESGHFCGERYNDGQPQTYTVHFDIVFSQPFTASKITGSTGEPSAVFLTFDTTSNPVIQAKVGISYVSGANAQLNWKTENPGWDFDSVKTAAQTSWDDLLGKIQVSGGSPSQTQEFYSLLYKDFLDPNIVSDVNGQYVAPDFNTYKISSPQQNQYGTYSGWDIYHSLSQLQAMLDPQAASDMAQSLLNYYDHPYNSADRVLQQWGYLQDNNYVMVGDPAQAIIADYYAFGAHSFDTGSALKAMLQQAMSVNDVRPGEALEAKYGYLPQDGTYGCCNPHGTVATLLEYDTEDLALSFFARAMGDTTDAATLEQRANNWANLFDPANGLLNARYENGQFVPGIDPLTGSNGDEAYYVEGDAYEYLWDTPNDYAGLFDALGGDSKVVPALEKYLSQPNGFGMYAELTNEFDFGEQFALDYAGDPAATQEIVNNIRDTMYAPGPDLDNNDDLGANSSTFIWEMLGMYPENPGSGNLVFASPGFPNESIHLANGSTVTINAPGASPSEYYVQQLFLNGSPYEHLYVPFSTLEKGATLDFHMGTSPTTWGSAPGDAPPSYTAGLPTAAGYTSTSDVTVAPGGSATFQVGAHNLTHIPQQVQVSLSPPPGVSVSPSTGTIYVPPDGSATITLTLSASPSAIQNFYSMPVSFSDNGVQLKGVTVTLLVASPGSLLRAFNNAGVSDNTDVGEANFDGGGASYSAQALADAKVYPDGAVSSGGFTYTWPLPSPGYPDNAMTDGQQVTVNAPAGTRQIGFLGSSTGGPSQGIVTLHYSDGSTSQYWLGFSDWTLNGGSASGPSFGNQIAIAMPYRNCSYCNPVQQQVKTYVFSASLPVDPGKTLTSATLPMAATQGELHIFAIATTTAAMSPPELDSVSPATAAAGQEVTIQGSGFGNSQGSSYVTFSDNGITWGPPNLLGTSQTGTLPWGGPDNDGCSSNIGALTSVDGGAGEQWTASCVTNQTWIQVTPTGLVNGQTYTASVTLEANSSQQTAPMFLDLYNGCTDTSSAVVTLTPGTPVTLTDSTTIGCSNAPQFQVRTAGSGSVDLTVTNASIANPNTIAVDSWSDTAVTFTVPQAVYPGSEAMVSVNVASGSTTSASDTGVLEIKPSSNVADYYNNAGITPDSNQTCSGTSNPDATYDGDGYAYSADALAKDGITPGATVNADGLTFTWPNVQACQNDNLLAEGQTMLVSGTGNTLGFLGSSTNGSSSGTVIVTYTDGTTSTATLSFNDWAGGPGSGDVSVAAMPYRNSFDGSQTINMWVYATTVPVDSSKTVASVTFPDVASSVCCGNTAMHIFALSLGTVSSTAQVGTTTAGAPTAQVVTALQPAVGTRRTLL
jgi:predicted alpha-1,2-mannosidase